MALHVWVLFCRIRETQPLGLKIFLHRSEIQPVSIFQKITALSSDSRKGIQLQETTQLVMINCKRKLQPSFQVTWRMREKGNTLFSSCVVDAVRPIYLL